MKAAANWDLMAEIFEKKAPTLQRLFTRGIDIVVVALYDTYVSSACNKSNMENYIKKNITFKNFPYALYATDVIFQQSNRPTGNMMEGKVYFSGKHKLYGYKSEVSVAPNGQAINCVAHEPGSVSDLTILNKNIEFHKERLKKISDEEGLQDNGMLSNTYQDSWAIIMDKGYQGAQVHLRAIIPKKEPNRKLLSIEDENWNKMVASDRIIVENFFGRLTKLWYVIASKYRWSEESYDTIFCICVALTNFHIQLHPLRDDVNAAHYRIYKNRNYRIGESIVKKRKLAQKRYRERRKQRIHEELEDNSNSSISSEECAKRS